MTDDLRPFRLSPRQEALWLAQREDPTYRAVLALALRGPLHKDALRDAALKVASRHEILRTTYLRRAGLKVPFQVVGENPSFGLHEVDLRGDRGRLDAVIADEGRRVIDLERGPIAHLVLARLDEEEHVLVLTLPALAADTRSLGHFAEELAHFYGAFRDGAKGGLADEPLQYADYAEFQREQGEGRAPAAADDGILALPFEQLVSDQAPFAPESIAIDLPPPLDAANLLAAFEVLLARLSGQPEITFEIVADGRFDDEMKGAIGLYSREAAVRETIDWESSFIAATRQARIALHRAQNGVSRGDRGAILFEVTPRAEDIESGGLRFSILQQHSHSAPFALKLACLVGGDARLFFDPARFDREAAARIAASFAALAQSAARDPNTAVGALGVLDEAWRRRILEDWNRTEASFPEARLHELFEAQAAKTPDRPALVFGDQVLSYAELDARANRLARLLRRHGVGSDVRVGLCVERSAAMIVGLLAVLKAGGAYVPLLPDAPRARLAHQLAEIGAPVLLTQEKLLGAFPAFSGEIVCLDRESSFAEPADALAAPGSPADLAYVIYTSGSTGTPKGVAVTHANLVNYTRALAAKLRLDAPENAEGLRFATVSTLAADLGNTCVFPALVSGGCLIVISHEMAMDGDLFGAYAKERPIDVLKITPSHLGALLVAREGRHILPRRWLITGGEASSWSLVDRVRALTDAAWINHYGPTETTIGSLTFDLAGVEAIRALAATVPIGRPIANTRVYVLDERRAPVPVGAPGELYIGGRGVARGYLNQPEATAERFLADPFAGDPSARMYRTGDRVRWLPDGSIEFLGRVDHQVKVRGFRVEPGEIEAALRRLPSVREVVVVPREDSPGDLRLVAYVVGHQKLAPDTLRAALAEQLPDYMIPSAFVALDALPLTPNGKVDRRALPTPEEARSSGSNVPPRTPVEERLAAIWSELLGVANVGVFDDFFELGGHSLIATQVVARVCSAFNVKVSLRTLFERPTIAAFAEAIPEGAAAGPDDELARMMAELGLSEEEVLQLLAAEEANS